MSEERSSTRKGGSGSVLFPVPCSLFPIQTLLEPCALALDELVRELRKGETPLFVGEGAVQHAEELRRELGAAVLPAHLGVPRASALIWLATGAPEMGRVEDPTAWEPDYVRAAGAERIAARAVEGPPRP